MHFEHPITFDLEKGQTQQDLDGHHDISYNQGIYNRLSTVYWDARYGIEVEDNRLFVNRAELDSAGSNKPLPLPLVLLDTSKTTSPTTTRFYRSLTSPTFSNGLNMTTTVPAPGSPPDLTGSKSSKSSSFQSSSHSSSIDGITTDIANFEDIGLDDDLLSRHDPYGVYSKRVETNADRNSIASRPSLSHRTIDNRSGPMLAGTQRELTNANKPNYPNSYGHLNGPSRDYPGLGLPNGGVPRRGFTSPSTPSLMMGLPRRTRSRSPSPGFCASPSPISPRSFTRGTPLLRQSSSPKPPPSRRGSWQPSRKTIKELEAECHDSDEEVDDDAVIWNVPMTPRPAQERSKSANVSANASASTSPERRSLSTKRALNGMENLSMQTSAPPAIGVIPSTRRTTPISPEKPNLPRGASMGSLPDHYSSYPKSERKSWHAALDDLSEEAKILTQALEAHADVEERQQEERLQKGACPPRPKLDKQRAKTTILELPPVRTSNIMIDPLPISKEKEKVLTRTRPSWLPPKCQKEEKRHLKEYQRMMSFSLEADKRRLAKEAELLHARESTKLSLSRIWDQHVLPNWDRVISEPRTRELWWRGVSPRSRGVVWQKAIGNELELTEASYIAALTRAKNIQAEIERQGSQGESRKEKTWFEAIERDVRDVFPELKIFQKGGPLNEGLVDVLMAYSMYRSDVGYVYGTHLIAALLLLTLPTPTQTFLLLANALNRPLPLSFHTNDPSGISQVYTLTLSLLSRQLPILHNHLVNTLNLEPEDWLGPMFRTLFLYHAGEGIEIVSRVWDVWVFEGDKVFVRVALGVLARLEGSLVGVGRERVLGLLGWGKGGRWDLGGEEEFMRVVRGMGKVERR
ncbi:MAG: hypothetical protein M1812_005736 [Candelaria pacifica]|nr:MAG: hypothetical protein M1812_005736 [Candelaria pacifica]